MADVAFRVVGRSTSSIFLTTSSLSLVSTSSFTTTAGTVTCTGVGSTVGSGDGSGLGGSTSLVGVLAVDSDTRSSSITSSFSVEPLVSGSTAGVAGGERVRLAGSSLHSAQDSSTCSLGLGVLESWGSRVAAGGETSDWISSTPSAALSLGGVSMFSNAVASSGNMASGCPSTIEALRQTCLTRGPLRSIRCRLSLGPAGGGAGAVVVVTTVAVTVAVTVVTAETTVVVVLMAGGLLTLGALVLAVVAGTAGDSTLFRGRRTFVVTSVFVVLAAVSVSSCFSFSFSTVGTVVSSLAGNGLLAALGLASELGARISDLSLMFSLMGGKLPNVVLF